MSVEGVSMDQTSDKQNRGEYIKCKMRDFTRFHPIFLHLINNVIIDFMITENTLILQLNHGNRGKNDTEENDLFKNDPFGP